MLVSVLSGSFATPQTVQPARLLSGQEYGVGAAAGNLFSRRSLPTQIELISKPGRQILLPWATSKAPCLSDAAAGSSADLARREALADFPSRGRGRRGQHLGIPASGVRKHNQKQSWDLLLQAQWLFSASPCKWWPQPTRCNWEPACCK